MAAFAIQLAPLAGQPGGYQWSGCGFRKNFTAVKDMEDAATAVDIFSSQEACLDGCIDGTALGFPAKPPHEVPRKAVVQS
jgi:hypothetical protein